MPLRIANNIATTLRGRYNETVTEILLTDNNTRWRFGASGQATGTRAVPAKAPGRKTFGLSLGRLTCFKYSMTNFEELLNIKLNEDKYTLAEITIEYCKRGHHPVPEWAINTRQEGRRKAQERLEADRAAKVRKRKKSAVRPSEDDLGPS